MAHLDTGEAERRRANVRRPTLNAERPTSNNVGGLPLHPGPAHEPDRSAGGDCPRFPQRRSRGATGEPGRLMEILPEGEEKTGGCLR